MEGWVQRGVKVDQVSASALSTQLALNGADVEHGCDRLLPSSNCFPLPWE